MTYKYQKMSEGFDLKKQNVGGACQPGTTSNQNVKKMSGGFGRSKKMSKTCRAGSDAQKMSKNAGMGWSLKRSVKQISAGFERSKTNVNEMSKNRPTSC